MIWGTLIIVSIILVFFLTRNKKKENIDYTKGLKSGEQDISEFIKKYHFEENKKREEELVIKGTKKREEREK